MFVPPKITWDSFLALSLHGVIFLLLSEGPWVCSAAPVLGEAGLAVAEVVWVLGF